MKIKALIFDCDGTLTDSMPLHFIAWREVMTRHGMAFPEERFYAMGGIPSDKIILMLCEEHGLSLDPVQIAHEKEAAFLEHLHTLTEIPAITNLARQYRGQLPMAVASGGLRYVIELQLKQIGLEGWFDTIVTAEDTELHKPEPDVFLEAASRLNADPARCVVFEDTDIGLEAARRAGMAGVDVRAWLPPREGERG